MKATIYSVYVRAKISVELMGRYMNDNPKKPTGSVWGVSSNGILASQFVSMDDYKGKYGSLPVKRPSEAIKEKSKKVASTMNVPKLPKRGPKKRKSSKKKKSKGRK